MRDPSRRRRQRWRCGPCRPLPPLPVEHPGVPTTTIFLPNITKMLGGPNGWVTPFIVQNIGVKKTTLEVSFFRFSDGGLVACRKIDRSRAGDELRGLPEQRRGPPSGFAVRRGGQIVRRGGRFRRQRASGPGPTHASGGALLQRAHERRDQRLSPVRREARRGTVSSDRCQLQPQLGHDVRDAELRRGEHDGERALHELRRDGDRDAHAHDRTGTVALHRSDGGAAAAGRPLLLGRPDLAAADRRRRERARRRAILTRSARLQLQRRAAADARRRCTSRTCGATVPRCGPTRAASSCRTPAPSRRGRPSRSSVSAAAVRCPITAPAAIKPGATWLFDPEQSPALAVGEHSLVVTGGTFAVLDATLVHGAAMGFVGASGQGNRAYLPERDANARRRARLDDADRRAVRRCDERDAALVPLRRRSARDAPVDRSVRARCGDPRRSALRAGAVRQHAVRRGGRREGREHRGARHRAQLRGRRRNDDLRRLRRDGRYRPHADGRRAHARRRAARDRRDGAADRDGQGPVRRSDAAAHYRHGASRRWLSAPSRATDSSPPVPRAARVRSRRRPGTPSRPSSSASCRPCR